MPMWERTRATIRAIPERAEQLGTQLDRAAQRVELSASRMLAAILAVALIALAALVLSLART
jgi:hypothetical protein